MNNLSQTGKPEESNEPIEFRFRYLTMKTSMTKELRKWKNSVALGIQKQI